MIQFDPRLRMLGLLALTVIIAGCPPTSTVTPTLAVSTGAISFPALSSAESFVVFNESGVGMLTWTAREVRWDAGDEAWVPGDASYFSINSTDADTVDPEFLQGTVSDGRDRIHIALDRSAITPNLIVNGEVLGFGVEISSEAGTEVVPVSVTAGTSFDVSPLLLNIATNQVSAEFTITNDGTNSLTWELIYIQDPGETEDIVEVDQPPFITTDQIEGSTLPRNSDSIEVTIDRTGLAEGEYNTFILVQTPVGLEVVQVRFGVGGVATFEVTPDEIVIEVNVLGSGANPTREITIVNGGTEDFDWTLSFDEGRSPGIPAQLPSFISFTELGGTVSAGREQVIGVEIQADQVPEASLTSVGVVVSATETITGNAIGSETVKLDVIATEGARLSIQQEPPFRQSGLLDFGTDEVVLPLGIGNTGGVGSLLEFSFTTDRPDLIKLPTPSAGNSVGFDCLILDYLFCHDWKQFPIVIDRGAMNPNADEDGGEIFIEAEGQDPIIIAVTVKRPPLTIEGATNRARPPNVQRFVFLMRDSLLNALDTNDPDVLRNLTFSIDENDVPLDLDETNFFVDGPGGLKTNIVLMLDFTSSMYHAREDDGIANGASQQEMLEGAIEFVRDLPDTYRLSIMEHHEKNQVRREIHPFSTDRDSLIASLENFSIAPAEQGATEIFDAIAEAVDALVRQDPIELPFDDADVRAIVIISDGNDTSSELTDSAVTEIANAGRVRVYPLTFGDSVNLAPLVTMAKSTGGHLFNVIEPRTLGDFLGTATAEGQIWHDLQRQVVLTYITLLDMSATYNIGASFLEENGGTISGSFSRDSIFFPGDFRQGQISLSTTGITPTGTAEVIVRTDFVPRDITAFRFRFVIPTAFQPRLTDVSLLGSSSDGGLLAGWRSVDEGDNVYSLLTDGSNPLNFGTFGNLMRLRFEGLDPADKFDIGFRVDNSQYAQASSGNTVNTKWFVYPGAHTNPGRNLIIDDLPDIAAAGGSLGALQDQTFDPDAEFAFDRDEDGIPDFDDPEPDAEDLPPVIVSPLAVGFPVNVTEGTFTITNNRLDTMNWEINMDSVDALEFGATFSATFGSLLVGERIDIVITVDRTGLTPNTYFGQILVDTNNLTPEPGVVRLTLDAE
jgi:hypothetical protein